MDYARSKQFYTTGGSNVYGLIADWWKDKEVPYVAHAISRNGTVTRLADALSLPASDSPDQHPDQQYWKTTPKKGAARAKDGISAALLAAGGIDRIEIDCKLMPCYVKGVFTKCTYQVPSILRSLYALNNTKLWIFSHANENQGDAHSSTKRRIICNTGDSNDKLSEAYVASDGWAWSP